MSDEEPRYLSDDWLARADAAVSDLDPIEAAVTVAVTVTDGPDGDRRYRLILGPDRVGVEPGHDPAGVRMATTPTGVRMTLTWDDAVAVAQGRSSAQRAFLDGRLRLGGDLSLLLGHQDALARIDDRLADLRATSRYS